MPRSNFVSSIGKLVVLPWVLLAIIGTSAVMFLALPRDNLSSQLGKSSQSREAFPRSSTIPSLPAYVVAGREWHLTAGQTTVPFRIPLGRSANFVVSYGAVAGIQNGGIRRPCSEEPFFIHASNEYSVYSLQSCASETFVRLVGFH